MEIIDKSDLDTTPDTPKVKSLAASKPYQRPESSTSATDSTSTALKLKEYLISFCKDYIESAYTWMEDGFRFSERLFPSSST